MKKVLLALCKPLLFALALCGLSLSLQAQDPNSGKDYRIVNVNKKFTPQKGFHADNKHSRVDPNKSSRVLYDQDQYFLVQFEELPSGNQKNQLKGIGITLLEYFPNNAWYAHFTKQLNSEQLGGFKIRSILSIDESFKLSQALFNNKIPSHAKKGDQVEVVLSFYTGADLTKAEKEIIQLASIVSRKANKWQVLVPQNKLRQLTAVKQIKFIEPISDAPQDEDINTMSTASYTRANFINSGYNGVLYNGSGETVMIRENSVDEGIDLKGRMVPGGTPQPGDPSAHSTKVSRYMGSSGNSNPRDRSIAWGSNVFNQSGGDEYALYDDAVKKVRGINMSYGWFSNNRVTAGYNSTSNEHDNFLRTRPGAMLIYSAGNGSNYTVEGGLYDGMNTYGNISGEAKHAKNLLTVSSTNQDDVVYSARGAGPAYDGRIKPELTTEGVGGTSYSAPKVTGLFATLSQVYKTEHAQASAPGALIKAMMMNTADDMYNPGIDFRTGFGAINARRSYLAIKNGYFFTNSLANGGQTGFNITVPAGTYQVRVMLYWHDYEATEGAGQALVNDLDLKVTDPGSTVYLPWGLNTAANTTSLNALPTRKVDHLNNVEQVTIDNPAAGNYSLSISGYNIPQGPQTFYVVYEFVRDEIILTYPLGGESMARGQTEYIRWDAYGAAGTFNLEYSVNNGATWTAIASNLASSKRSYLWTVPSISSKILVRIKRGAQTSVSGETSIFPTPANFGVRAICTNSVKLGWGPVAGATQYEVYKLGPKYMELVGTTADTTFIVSGTNTNVVDWFSIKALGANGLVSLRSDALQKNTGTFNCTNNPPTVSVTSPVNNATFTAPATITINATAADADGTVTKVEFFQGSTKLGEDLTSPYSFTWNSVAGGNYTLTAKATDNAGAVTTSSIVNITVNSGNAPPTVSVTSPVNNATFTPPATITINATAADSDGTVTKVEFFQGSTLLGEDLTAPYSFTWNNVPVGNYVLTAKATDNSANVTTSSAVNISVSTCTGSDIPSAQMSLVYFNSQETAGENGAASNAIDGNTTTYWHTKWSGGSDPYPHELQIDLGTTYFVSTFKYLPRQDGSANGRVAGYEIYVSDNTSTWGAAVATGTFANTSTEKVVTFTEKSGRYVRFRALSEVGGNAYASAAEIKVSGCTTSNTPPTVSVTSPANNATFTAPATITINATASDADGTVSKVEFFQGSTLLGEDITSPYSFTWNGVAAGSYALTAKATDNGGATTTSAVVNVNVVSGCGSAFEPNETQATAAAITAGVTNSAAITTTTDIDYYAVTTTGITNNTFSLVGPSGVDFDLKIYNSAGTEIGTSTSNTATETVTLNNQAAATYYIKVYGYNGANSATCYTITATTVAVTCPGIYDVSTNGTVGGAATIPFNTDIKGLISPSGDNDYYKFVITTGGTATITLTTLPADYDIILYSSNGTTELGYSENGGTTSETISHTYTPGTYYVRVLGYNGANSSTSCYTLKVALGTAEADIQYTRIDVLKSGKISIQAFPNPAKNVLNLNLAGFTGIADTKVYDLQGRVMMHRRIVNGSTALDISGLSAGMYLVKVKDNNHQVATLKFVKE